MDKIYECKRCGAHHLASTWAETTYKMTRILAAKYTIQYCPSCEHASLLEDIDYLSTGFAERFWPYLSK